MLDVGRSRRELTDAIYATLRANDMTDGVHVRLMVTRGVKRTPYQDPRVTIGPATQTFRFGLPGAVPVAGDWDGDGETDIGVFQPTTATWALRRSASAGPADQGMFRFFRTGQRVTFDVVERDGETVIRNLRIGLA